MGLRCIIPFPRGYVHIRREKLQANILELLQVSSKDQVVDFVTKALLPQPFNNFLSKFGIINIYQPSTCQGILYHEQNKAKRESLDE